MNPNALQLAEKLLKQFEGCRLQSYQDQGAVWTCGWGSTGPDIGPGLKWSQQQADERFESDLSRFMQGVADLIKVPVSDCQLAATCSFAYNVGLHNVQRSGFLKLLNQHSYPEAADQLLLWDKIGSYTSPGLLARRTKERAVFLGSETNGNI